MLLIQPHKTDDPNVQYLTYFNRNDDISYPRSIGFAWNLIIFSNLYLSNEMGILFIRYFYFTHVKLLINPIKQIHTWTMKDRHLSFKPEYNK